MLPGDLARLIDDEEEKITLVISTDKKPLIGNVYQILKDSNLVWVYPEDLIPVARINEEEHKEKKRL
tara:strand:+ start:776 stop:976 length:201 start_codon:yes stop_codon:yes gene_type:complete